MLEPMEAHYTQMILYWRKFLVNFLYQNLVYTQMTILQLKVKGDKAYYLLRKKGLLWLAQDII